MTAVEAFDGDHRFTQAEPWTRARLSRTRWTFHAVAVLTIGGRARFGSDFLNPNRPAFDVDNQ